MKILLDTHIFLWALLTPEKLTDEAIELLESAGTEKYLSAASSWEIAVKHAMGSLVLSESPREFVMANITAAGISPLPIGVRDTLQAIDLPPIHKDPFDRLLVAQAQANQMFLLTNDPVFENYDVRIIDL